MSPESTVKGTIYQIKSGRNAGKWCCEVKLVGAARRSAIATSRDAAEAKLAAFHNEDVVVAPPQLTAAARIEALVREAAPARANRRRRGGGTMYEVKTGRNAGKWRCEIMPPDGKRRTFLGTKEETEVKLVEFQNAVVHHAPLPPARTTRVGAYAHAWVANRKNAVAAGSWKGEDSDVRNHIVPSLGNKFLVELAPADMRRFYKQCAERGLSHKSVGYVRGTLSLILSQALEDGLVTRNVAAQVKLGKAPKEQPIYKAKPFTPDEARRFLDEVKGTPEEALYVTTLGLALRRGEVLGLRWSDIIWKTRHVKLNGQTQRVEGEGVKWVPTAKTEDSLAVLDVPDFVMDVLVMHRDRYAFLGRRPGDYVFPGLEDPSEPLDPDKVTKDFPKWLEAHGLRRIRFHDLRHSAASMYLVLGVELWKVSKILRHSTVKLTSDTYGHLYAHTSREAADVMGNWMAGGS